MQKAIGSDNKRCQTLRMGPCQWPQQLRMIFLAPEIPWQSHASNVNSKGKVGRNGKAILALFLVLEPREHNLGICCPSTWNRFPLKSRMAHPLTSGSSVIKSMPLFEIAHSPPELALFPVSPCWSFIVFIACRHFKWHLITLLLYSPVPLKDWNTFWSTCH